MTTNIEAVTSEFRAILAGGALALCALALSFMASMTSEHHTADGPNPSSLETQTTGDAVPRFVPQVTAPHAKLALF